MPNTGTKTQDVITHAWPHLIHYLKKSKYCVYAVGSTEYFVEQKACVRDKRLIEKLSRGFKRETQKQVNLGM